MAILILSGLFGITGSAYSAEARGVTDDTVKIGVILDQTGPAADVVVPTTQGIKTYFKYINEQGGGLMAENSIPWLKMIVTLSHSL